MARVFAKAGPRIDIVEVGVNVSGFEDIGGALGVSYTARFFQDGRMVELSANAPFETNALELRQLVRGAIRDAGYGEVASTARIRIAGA